MCQATRETCLSRKGQILRGPNGSRWNGERRGERRGYARGTEELPGRVRTTPAGRAVREPPARSPKATAAKNAQVPLDNPEKQVKYEEQIGVVLEKAEISVAYNRGSCVTPWILGAPGALRRRGDMQRARPAFRLPGRGVF